MKRAALNIEELRRQARCALLIKGILAPADAQRALDAGADGIMLSNHGGRELDGSVSAMEVLPEIRQLCGADATLLIDSGFRRGTDVVKALAQLGCTSVNQLGPHLLRSQC